MQPSVGPVGPQARARAHSPAITEHRRITFNKEGPTPPARFIANPRTNSIVPQILPHRTPDITPSYPGYYLHHTPDITHNNAATPAPGTRERANNTHRALDTCTTATNRWTQAPTNVAAVRRSSWPTGTGTRPLTRNHRTPADNLQQRRANPTSQVYRQPENQLHRTPDITPSYPGYYSIVPRILPTSYPGYYPIIVLRILHHRTPDITYIIPRILPHRTPDITQAHHTPDITPSVVPRILPTSYPGYYPIVSRILPTLITPSDLGRYTVFLVQ